MIEQSAKDPPQTPPVIGAAMGNEEEKNQVKWDAVIDTASDVGNLFGAIIEILVMLIPSD